MFLINSYVTDVPEYVVKGINWATRIVTEKQLVWKEGAAEVIVEVNSSRGNEDFFIKKGDLRYHE